MNMHNQPGDNADHGYETSDANARRILLCMAGVAAFLALSFLVLGSIYGFRPVAGFRPRSADPRFDFKHGAKQQTSIEEDWVSLDQETKDHLTGYGWVDSTHVHIPIGKAMESVAKDHTTP